jgi:hypothetical protein
MKVMDSDFGCWWCEGTAKILLLIIIQVCNADFCYQSAGDWQITKNHKACIYIYLCVCGPHMYVYIYTYICISPRVWFSWRIQHKQDSFLRVKTLLPCLKKAASPQRLTHDILGVLRGFIGATRKTVSGNAWLFCTRSSGISHEKVATASQLHLRLMLSL